MNIKLNEKGKRAISKWWQIYIDENDRLGGNYAKGDIVEGWSIIDTDNFIKTLEDEAELLIFAYEEDVFNIIDEWMVSNHDNENGICGVGFTYKQVREKLTEYFINVDVEDFKNKFTLDFMQEE